MPIDVSSSAYPYGPENVEPLAITGASENTAAAGTENAAQRISTVRNAGSSRVKRRPDFIAEKNPSGASFGSGRSRFQRDSTTSIATNESPLSANAIELSANVSSAPPSAGPMARDRLNDTAPSATAGASCPRGTMSAMFAVQAGTVIADCTPSRNVSSRSTGAESW